MEGLSQPACWMGYPMTQLREALGVDRYNELGHWLRGQTIGICSGERYDHALAEYVQTCSVPHGTVVYAWDVDRFLSGLPIID